MTEKALPHNIEAEEAVLGSVIISPVRVAQVADFLRAEDFYREAHRVIFQGILDLYHRAGPADFVTLTDLLEQQGKLEGIGGQSTVAGLINKPPSTLNVDYYAHIVERMSLMRKLIYAAGEIARLAYDAEDGRLTLDKAEQMLYSIGQGHIHTDFSPIADLLDEYYKKLDHLHTHHGGLVGISTGFTDLDRMTGGLQKSDLIILAARPAVGKSSLALTLAYNVARPPDELVGAEETEEKPKRVAFFALEMSKEQLLQRLLSMRTGIDQHRLKSGLFNDEEWRLISQALGELGRFGIFIDDTAALSVMEMRSKARRLAAQHQGLDLIVVDYLQLMQGHPGAHSENRVQEVSEISRSLKALARELKVPVLALSQLSRSVESRQSRVPQLSDLRESGCLAGETLIYLPDEGISRRIDQLVGKSGFNVLALNPETWKLEPRPVARAFSTGRKPVYRLRTQLGRSVRATANHQFLTIEGWRRLDELLPGMQLALPRSLPGPAIPTMSKTERQFQAAPGMSYCGATLYKSTMSRERAARVAHVVRSEALTRLAVSDVYWDEVVAIEPDGEEEVYDLTVDGLHNFVANTIVVHNSIEQDSDIVLFIYRDEMYNPDSDRKNTADIIVAKHRNGPTGQFSLRFDANKTLFQNLATHI